MDRGASDPAAGPAVLRRPGYPAAMAALQVSRETARRFLMGRQGLWPGRRWRGPAGTDRAIRAMGNLQLDPLRVVARAQDLALASRVLDYEEGDWARLTYERRRFFEWGGWLAVRPIDELPYYRVLMRRSHEHDWARWATAEHADAIAEMRQVLRDRSEVANRHFAMGERKRVDSYRGRKDSAVALHHLWRVGEAMVIRRTPTFERVYARPERVVRKRLLREAPEDVADDFLLLKAVRTAGFSRLRGARAVLGRRISAEELAAWRDRQLADGALVEVQVEGLIGRHLALAADVPAIEALGRGRLPRGWQAAGPTTTDEVTFLSPLDPVIHDRARTLALFGFDYKWGVYDKVEKRRFGYYDLPILWADRLVGRADFKVDRSGPTMSIAGLWWEAGISPDEPGLVEALDRGLERLARLAGAPPPTVGDPTRSGSRSERA
jgi:uncharacterized protein